MAYRDPFPLFRSLMPTIRGVDGRLIVLVKEEERDDQGRWVGSSGGSSAPAFGSMSHSDQQAHLADAHSVPNGAGHADVTHGSLHAAGFLPGDTPHSHDVDPGFSERSSAANAPHDNFGYQNPGHDAVASAAQGRDVNSAPRLGSPPQKELKAGHEVAVSSRPNCDLCHDGTKANYDSRLPALGGSWGNVCDKHFAQFGPGKTGVGNAQKLVPREDKPAAAKPAPAKMTKPPTVATMHRWMNDGIARATDGCKTEPDGHCEHGKPSWLLHMGIM